MSKSKRKNTVMVATIPLCVATRKRRTRRNAARKRLTEAGLSKDKAVRRFRFLKGA